MVRQQAIVPAFAILGAWASWCPAPQVVCRYECANYDGVPGMTGADFLILLSEYGRVLASSDPKACLDSELSLDQYVDLFDLTDWETYLAGGLDSCGTGGVSTFQGARGERQGPSDSDSMPAGSLLVSGKPNAPGEQNDLLYVMSGEGDLTPSSVSPAGGAYSRANGRLVQDGFCRVYQVHGIRGLVRLSDGQAVISPRNDLVWGVSTVIVGVIPTGSGGFFGVPIQDAAFDPSDHTTIYVVPILVSVPPDGSLPAHTYRAAAKLVLDPGNPGQYSLAQLYGTDPSTEINTGAASSEALLNVQKLREIEISRNGEWLYVSSSLAMDENEWLLVYDTQSGAESRIQLTGLDPALRAPIALLASGRQDKLYLASSGSGTAGQVFRLGIAGAAAQFEGAVAMPDTRQITCLTEDPASGRLYVVGFQAPDIAEDLSRTDPLYAQYFSDDSPVFTSPRVLTIQPAATWLSSTVQALSLGSTDLALPMAAVCVPSPAPADFDGDCDVDVEDLNAFIACAAGPALPVPSGCEEKDLDHDGDVDQDDFGILQRCYSGDPAVDPSCAR